MAAIAATNTLPDTSQPSKYNDLLAQIKTCKLVTLAGCALHSGSQFGQLDDVEILEGVEVFLASISGRLPGRADGRNLAAQIVSPGFEGTKEFSFFNGASNHLSIILREQIGVGKQESTITRTRELRDCLTKPELPTSEPRHDVHSWPIIREIRIHLYADRRSAGDALSLANSTGRLTE